MTYQLKNRNANRNYPRENNLKNESKESKDMYTL
jgi:hypothetical protein